MRTKRATWPPQKQAQERASAFHRTVAQFGYFGSILAVVGQRIGMECGAPRRPLRAVSSEERETLLAQVEALEIGLLADKVLWTKRSKGNRKGTRCVEPRPLFCCLAGMQSASGRCGF